LRNEVLLKLNGLLHLLSTNIELQDPSGEAFKTVLLTGVSGGLPTRDGSMRDSTELLDNLARILTDNAYPHFSRISPCKGGYFYLLSICYLARNLASHKHDSVAQAAMRHRMIGMRNEVINQVFSVALNFLLSKDREKNDLVQAALEVCFKGRCRKFYTSDLPMEISIENWNTMVLSIAENSSNF